MIESYDMDKCHKMCFYNFSAPIIGRVLMAGYYMLSTLYHLCVCECVGIMPSDEPPPAWSPSPPPGGRVLFLSGFFFSRVHYNPCQFLFTKSLCFILSHHIGISDLIMQLIFIHLPGWLTTGHQISVWNQ